MAVIYISSTYEDLRTERQAASQAVRRLDHMTIAMDDYVASDKRPVDKCLEDVLKCDIYIGIFAWRYGFIPDGYDKSITHLEYEAARKAGIPRLIFLLNETANWPVNYVSTGEEREKIDKLRSDLTNERIVSFFTNPDDLGGAVSAAVSRTVSDQKPDFQKSTPPLSGKPKLGPIVSKLCNRLLQEREFWDFFQRKSKECPKQPQFYFIHGDESEGHESFLERLMKTCLKEYAENQWGKENATIYLKEVLWPDEGNRLVDRQKQLRFNLMNKFDPWGNESVFTANTLSNLTSLDKRPLVLIKHTIFASMWDKQTEQLITWYIREYWGDIECSYDIPQFLVFFDIQYPKLKKTRMRQKLFKWKHNTKERIRKHLQDIYKFLDNECPCQLIEELTPVKIEDVKKWFIENEIYREDEWLRAKKVNSIFSEDNTPGAARSMEEIEHALLNVLEEYQREEI